MKKNKLCIANNARNHIKFIVFHNCITLPNEEGEALKALDKLYATLEASKDAYEHYHYSNNFKGISINVWEYEGRFYLIYCLRNEFRTYNTTIYVDEVLDTLLKTAKFLHDNVFSIGKDYKKQIIEAKEHYIPNIDNDTRA